MSEFPLGYEKIEPATWAYLSSLLMIGLFFKFNRVWSVRNLDVVLLILLAPGLLIIHEAKILQQQVLGERSNALAELVKEKNRRTREETHEYSDPNDSDQSNPAATLDDASDVSGDEAKPELGNPAASGSDAGEANNATLDSVERDSVDRGQAAAGNPSRPQVEDETANPAKPLSAKDAGDEYAQLEPRENELESAPTDESASKESALDGAGKLQIDESDLTEAEMAAIRAIDGRYDGALRFERNGYILLFCVGALILIRMLVDPMMVRRPLLEPNLASGGMTFLGCSLLVFLISNVITSETTPDDLDGAIVAREMVSGVNTGTEGSDEESNQRYQLHGPGYSMLYLLPVIPTVVQNDGQAVGIESVEQANYGANVWTAKVMAIISQLAIVLGIGYIGTRHFNNFSMGVGAAALYLMLPYTAMMTGRVTHALPAALIVWAIAYYRKPLLAGCLIGIAMGTVYYPLFLLPLWISFYWRRGKNRFLIGFLISVVLMGAALAFDATSVADYFEKLRAMFGAWQPRMKDLHGIWALGWDSIYRLPILAGFVLLSATFAFWPAQKNLGTLINCSCAVMIAVQFWHGFGGGLHMAWYLPLLLLAIFRPNLEDRVALSVLTKGWSNSKRASVVEQSDRAVA